MKRFFIFLALIPSLLMASTPGAGTPASANTVLAGPSTPGASAALPTYRTVTNNDVSQAVSTKMPVRAATTTNGTLSTAFANGQTVDGVTLATGDRILLKNQTIASDNGLYTVNASGAPTRATDADTSAELPLGLTVAVKAGSTNANAIFVMTANADPVVLGTSNLTFTAVSGGSGAPTTSKYLLQVADGSLPNAQAMGALGTGLVKNTTTTGVQSIAVAGTDYVAPSTTVAGHALSANVSIAASDLTNGTTGTGSILLASAPSSGQLLVGNTTIPAFVSMSGDATLANTGALTIGPNAITTSKITDANVTTAKLASAARPVYNYLINGDFAIDQRKRGIPLSATQNSYYLDRWYFLSDQSANAQGTQQSSSSPDAGSQFYADSTAGPAGSFKCGIAQVVASTNVYALRGRTVRFQARVKTSQASKNVRMAIISWTGTADTVTRDVVHDWTSSTFTTGNFFNSTSIVVSGVSSAVVPGTSWTDAAVTGTVDSSATNVICFVFTETAISSTEHLYVSKAGLYDGPDARDWLPRLAQEEMGLCLERCYQLTSTSSSSVAPLAFGTTSTTTNIRCILNMPVRMARVPTNSDLSVSGGSHFLVQSSGSNISVSGLSIVTNGGSLNTALVDVTVGTVTIGTTGVLIFDSNAGRWLRIDVEL